MLGKAGKLKFNTSMLNKSINKKIRIIKKEKNVLTPNFWIVVYIVTQNVYFE